MKNGDFRFSKKDKLLKKFEFVRVFKKGTRRRGKHLEYIYLPNDLGGSRLGLVVSKKVGKAHTRNRTKRLIREAFRLNRFKAARNVDLVVRPLLKFTLCTYQEMESDFLRFFSRLNSMDN